jgi:hypothetical protein
METITMKMAIVRYIKETLPLELLLQLVVVRTEIQKANR